METLLEDYCGLFGVLLIAWCLNLLQGESHSCRSGGQDHRGKTEGQGYGSLFFTLGSFVSSRPPILQWLCVLLLQGYVPLFVNATAGSTVYGAFDPINEIADICEKYNLWLHVDVSSGRWSGFCSALVVVSVMYCMSLPARLLKCCLSSGGVGRWTTDVQEASPQA